VQRVDLRSLCDHCLSGFSMKTTKNSCELPNFSGNITPRFQIRAVDLQQLNLRRNGKPSQRLQFLLLKRNDRAVRELSLRHRHGNRNRTDRNRPSLSIRATRELEFIASKTKGARAKHDQRLCSKTNNGKAGQVDVYQTLQVHPTAKEIAEQARAGASNQPPLAAAAVLPNTCFSSR